MARIERLASLLKREISDIVNKEIISGADLGIVSIVDVTISKDKAHAKVYYSHLGSEKNKVKVHQKLTKAARYIKGIMGRIIRTATVPEIRFIYDKSIERGVDLVNKINALSRKNK